MEFQTLEDAFVHELKDLLSAEKQITKAMPKLAKKAHDRELKSALEKHLQRTEGQIERLEKAFEAVGQKPKSETCEGMKGLLEEGSQVLKEESAPDVMDALLIASAQKVEHYEIASYGTVSSWAEQLGFGEAHELLTSILKEEKEADRMLTSIAGRINKQAH